MIFNPYLLLDMYRTRAAELHAAAVKWRLAYSRESDAYIGKSRTWKPRTAAAVAKRCLSSQDGRVREGT
jgi:hypothetical protein